MTREQVSIHIKSIEDRCRIDGARPDLSAVQRAVARIVVDSLSDEDGPLGADIQEIRAIADDEWTAIPPVDEHQGAKQQFLCRLLFTSSPGISVTKLRRLARPCLLLFLAARVHPQETADALELPVDAVKEATQRVWDSTLRDWDGSRWGLELTAALKYLETKLPETRPVRSAEENPAGETPTSPKSPRRDIRVDEDRMLHVANICRGKLSPQHAVLLRNLIANWGNPVAHGVFERARIANPVKQKYRLVRKFPDLDDRITADSGFLRLS